MGRGDRKRKRKKKNRESEGRDSTREKEGVREMEKNVFYARRTVLVSRTLSIVAVRLRIALLARGFTGRPSFSAQVPFFICRAKNGPAFFAVSHVAFSFIQGTLHTSPALCVHARFAASAYISFIACV